jgi:rRNA maturation endonuclease Nob1
MEFFRHCPGCGRRFHIVLVDKSLVDTERTESVGVIQKVGGWTLVREGPPMIFDIKEFRYAYKCKHCGHEWSETRLEDHALHPES